MTDARSIATAISRGSRSRRRLVTQRLGAILAAIDPAATRPATVSELVTRVVTWLESATDRDSWLALSVLAAELPLEADVVDFTRRIRIYGAATALADVIGARHGRMRWPAIDQRRVEVITTGVLVDVNHTSSVEFATGIQRVVRETVRRWVRDHDVLLVGWTADATALRRLSASERSTAVSGAAVTGRPARTSTVIVPFGATYVLPELNINQSATRRLAALARWSPGATGAIGFDTVPLSSPETTDPGMPAAFANTLVAIRQMDVVVAISAAAAAEYAGWRRMLSSAGIAGPAIATVLLGNDHSMPTDGVAAPASATPLVLCVGSHEPRKNHLAVLAASEILWQRGLEFEVVFVGGNAWRSEGFAHRLAELAARGRPVSTRNGVSDSELDALYRRAAFTVFPSLNEGYGLPVVESLRRGTPVITSDFGSMREIATHGGTVFVDPRDDDSIADAMALLLTDETLRAALGSEASSLPLRTWDDYAEDVWAAIVDRPVNSVR
jgi:glycosyltransferase involved in cell wall biosynthesis